MPLLRRTPTTVADPDEAATDAATAADSGYTPGKGRPTPKRSEARQSRRVPAPKNSKEAAKLRRERDKDTRSKARDALRTGDERFLPARDRAPGRRLARDIVDSRFMLGQYALMLILVLFLLSTTPNPTIGLIVRLMLLVVTVVVLAQAWMIAGVAQKRVIEAHGVAASRGIKSYVIMRALSARRMRRPPPKVKRGETV